MIRQLPVIFLVAAILAACSGKNKIPDGILPQQKMESILWDMISADEFVSGYVMPKNPSLDRKQESLRLYDKIFHIYKVDKEEFWKSLSFYQSHPSLLMNVLDSINAKHSVIPSRSIHPKLIDSLKLKDKAIQ